MKHTTQKILITDDVDPSLITGLQQQGFTVDFMPDIKPDKVVELIPTYEGLIVNSKIYAGKELFDKAINLRFVCRVGSGLEVIDREYAALKGIAAFNSPEGNRVAVAEHALGMLLAMMNNLVRANASVKNGEWKREENRGVELSGKTVALIAYGHNAQAFARLLAGFSVKVLAYDKYYQGFSDSLVKEASLQQIFDEADVLSLHLPLTAETEYMIDYEFLSKFRKPLWFINISRGKVLRTVDLLRCLEEGKILGAALDVLENEKLNTLTTEQKTVFEKLCVNEKIILSPHVAGWTYESKVELARVLLNKISRLYSENTLR
ncbi:MAG: NAD(P)-dependent oxidoreductase [Chitinophagales bacterium]